MSYFGFSTDYGSNSDSGPSLDFGTGYSFGSGPGSNYQNDLKPYGHVYANGCLPYGGGIGPSGSHVTVWSSI